MKNRAYALYIERSIERNIGQNQRNNEETIAMPRKSSPWPGTGKRAARRGTSLLKQLIAAVITVILAGIGSWSYVQTGKVIPRRELLTGKASFHFIDVGQGDATLILTGDAAVLIDAGTNASADALVAYLQTYVGALDYLILTHPHDDHVGGADEVMKAIPVEHLLLPMVENNGYLKKLLSLAETEGIEVLEAGLGGQYTAGDITCTLLGPVHTQYENINNVSAVVRADVGGVSLLVSGDAEQEAEADVLAANAPALLRCDIYQVGHHGSSTSTSLEFYAAIQPDYCVISCGRGNSYGHPHTTVTDLLSLSGARVYRTDLEGTVVLDTDGESITRRSTFPPMTADKAS